MLEICSPFWVRSYNVTGFPRKNDCSGMSRMAKRWRAVYPSQQKLRRSRLYLRLTSDRRRKTSLRSYPTKVRKTQRRAMTSFVELLSTIHPHSAQTNLGRPRNTRCSESVCIRILPLTVYPGQTCPINTDWSGLRMKTSLEKRRVRTSINDRDLGPLTARFRE